ncbi:carbonic anhydrase [Magnetospirillum molischianum]|uniref:Carbonic anhydrase 2 n=1 Tax=Magnetospirillum molischianum DSM 120 TaxID=1150626 RepID=H8FX53_MAGML|nr:carbonic anhydrase [Magnetospirillum molischianum]CCG42941.1 Carbonic anhydrase 2 [Magnetospirillum molischianum DSM 120]
MTDLAGINRLLDNNRQWAEMVERTRPGLLADLARQQAPRYLWIGCADSRVPANEIVGLASGELFVHRNIANLVQHGDLNCLSVLQFAIDQLQVRDIILCGHYGCSGVRAVLREDSLGIAEHWLHPLRELAHRHQDELSRLEGGDAQVDRLCELNVLEQVRNLCRIPIVRRAWQRGQALSIHSWIYGLRDGLVRTLAPSLDGPSPAKAGL